MEPEYLKTLWQLRFEKIRKTEEEAAWTYQDLLDKCLIELGEKDEAVAILRELVQDERRHEKLGRELIEICRRNHPECS